MKTAPKLTPELDVADLDRSLDFYLEVLGFHLLFCRPEERFAYLTFDGDALHFMLKEPGAGRRYSDARLEHPYGRGVSFQIEVPDVRELYARVLTSGLPVPIPLEDRWYRENAVENGNRQFVVADPDGYLLRFFTDLGERPAPA